MLHNIGLTHPESPERLTAIDSRLQMQGIKPDLICFQARPVQVSQLRRAHHRNYIENIFNLGTTTKNPISLDSDTAIGPGSLDAALVASGAGCQAVDTILNGTIDRAFCAVRPPGHHAEASLAMGFCIFNNIAVATLHAIEHHGLQRVAIVDFDVHNGNGTIDIFKEDERVMVCSSFQHPFYPNRHHSTPGEHLILIPIESGTSSIEYRKQVEKPFFEALDHFKPELILISAGFDAHEKDPLGGLCLNEEDYRWLTFMLINLAKIHCKSRIVSILEGG